MKHTTLFRPLASLLILGGLLLPALIGCGVGEIPEATTATTASDADPTPETPAEPVSLTSLYAGKTVVRVDFIDFDFSYTTFSTTDPAILSALNDTLTPVMATIDPTLPPFHGNQRIVIHFTDGSFSTYDLCADDSAVNYSVDDPSVPKRTEENYRLSPETHLLLKNYIGSQIQTLIPLTVIPAPEDYLKSEINKTLLILHENTDTKQLTLTQKQATDLASSLKELLTDLPLSTQPWQRDETYYEVAFAYSNNQCAEIAIYPALGIIRLHMVTDAIQNSYDLTISKEDAEAYCAWLVNYYNEHDTERSIP